MYELSTVQLLYPGQRSYPTCSITDRLSRLIYEWSLGLCMP